MSFDCKNRTLPFMPILNRILPLLRGGGARGGAGFLGVASGWTAICCVFSSSFSIPGCTVKPVAADRSLGLPAWSGGGSGFPPSCVDAMPVEFLSLVSNLYSFNEVAGSDLPNQGIINHSSFS